MIFAHTCLLCGHPCQMTLAMTSENCVNPKCEAYAPALKALEKTEPPPAPPKGMVEVPSQDGRPTMSWKDAQAQALPSDVPCVVNGCTGRIHIDLFRACARCSTCHAYFDIENNIHDAFTLKLRNVASRFIDKGLNLEGVKTGRFSSKEPHFSNPPRGGREFSFGPSLGESQLDLIGGGRPRHFPIKSPGVTGVIQHLAEEMITGPRLQEYINKRLRWPNTMRVVDREAQTKTKIIKNMLDILGVLSLVDVIENANVAVYDYIAIKMFGGDYDEDEMRSSARARITVEKLLAPRKPKDRPAYAKKFEDKIGTKENFEVRLKRKYGISVQTIHLPAIALEFEFDMIRPARDAHPRNPTTAELALFDSLRKGK